MPGEFLMHLRALGCFSLGFAFLLAARASTVVSSTNESADHWAFQPLTRPPAPESKHSNPIDAFVSEALKKKGHTFAAAANRRTLIRRLSFDLRGLPPSSAE